MVFNLVFTYREFNPCSAFHYWSDVIFGIFWKKTMLQTRVTNIGTLIILHSTRNLQRECEDKVLQMFLWCEKSYTDGASPYCTEAQYASCSFDVFVFFSIVCWWFQFKGSVTATTISYNVIFIHGVRHNRLFLSPHLIFITCITCLHRDFPLTLTLPLTYPHLP